MLAFSVWCNFIIITVIKLLDNQVSSLSAGYDALPHLEESFLSSSDYSSDLQNTKNNPIILPLRRHMLKNSNVTCNDGTKAGYYFRESRTSSKRWIIFLEGGWYCFSPETCRQRWLQMRNLMSSAHWPQVRRVGGILSSSKDENPYFWNSNHVFVPYCSSDSWSGDLRPKKPSDLAFLGSKIIEQVVLDLVKKRQLADGRMLLLTGSSAGAVGVLINLDRVADILHDKGSKIEVRGIVDSGWFLDNEPFRPLKSFFDDNQSINTCSSPFNCSPLESVKKGMSVWNGQVPQKCRLQYPNEPWRCYFGYRVHQTLRSPLFVFQWLYDEAQMIADNVAIPVNHDQWNYLLKMESQLRDTLANVTAVFVPSCVSHIILTKSSWINIQINNTPLPLAIKCWEMQKSLGEDKKVGKRGQEKINTDESRSQSREYIFPHKLTASLGDKLKKKLRKKHRKHKKRHHNVFRSKRLANKDCNFHLVDTCTGPRCNFACSKIQLI